MCDFGHIDSVLTVQMFRQYCCSFHGAPLSYLNSDGYMCSLAKGLANYI